MCSDVEDEKSYLINGGALEELGIPRRGVILHSSWLFLSASAVLLCQFVLIYKGYLDSNPSLVNLLGVVNSLLWFHGFLVLVEWLRAIKAGWLSLGTALVKLAAAVIFALQPTLAIINQDGGPAASNLIGTCVFHAGNCMSLFEMVVLLANKPGGLAYPPLLTRGNIPVLAMCLYTSATSILVATNTWVYWGIQGTHSSLLPSTDEISGFEITGGTLLVLGSLLYVAWAGPPLSFSAS